MEEIDREALIAKIVELEAVKKELKARKLATNLFEFNKQVLQVEEGKGSLELASFHEELCDFIDNDKTNKKLVLIPRGHLKSTLVTVGYSLMRIAQDPGVRILIANATYDMSTAFLNHIKKHLRDNEVFKDYYGDFSDNPDKWAENMIAIGKKRTFGRREATVTTYGIGGNLVSQHYDLIIMDDIVNRDFVNTAEQIEKTILFYKDALDLLEPNGKMIIIGTRWADSDLYGWIMDTTNTEQVYKSFDIMVRKAFEGDLEQEKDLKLLWPGKFTRSILQNLRQEKGPYEFGAQYMNDPVPSDAAKFKPDWIKTVLEDELKVREMNYFTMVDPAIGQLKSSDNTAIVTIGVDQWNNWFVVNVIWGKYLPNEVINLIFANWEHFQPRKIGIEMTAYQKSLQYALVDEMRRRNVYLPIVELKANRSKDERIEGMVPRYANGSIYHLLQCPFREQLEDELVRFPRGKHDDIIDALAYGMQIASPSGANSPRFTRGEDRKPDRYLY